MMTDKQLEKMVKDIVGAVDYDHAKNLDPRTAEEPECAAEELARLVAVARRHLPATKGERKRRATPKKSKDT